MTRLAVAFLLLLSLLLFGGCFDQGRALERSYSRMLAESGAYPYVADGPYAEVLADCMQLQSASESCRFSTLPPLGYPDLSPPSVEAVMERVLVSEDWMGERFEAFLREMPEDMLYLFRSLTALTIAGDVRPSYYSSWRGAVFIDPNYLWFTPEERADIDLSPDFRSDFGSDLRFHFPWRYVKDNDYAFRIVSVEATDVEPRGMDDILLALARLLYHELAHAVDYMAPARIPDVAPTTRFAWVAEPTVSAELSAQSPLMSQIMRGLARVRYLGEASTTTQRSYTPEQVGDEFAPDHAVHFYSYSTEREDQAMLFEAVMSLCHFDMAMDVATTPPLESGASSNELVVAWGERNRVARPEIQARAALILERMLPDYEGRDCLEDLPDPVALVPGASWHENLDPATLSPLSAPVPLDREQRMDVHEAR